MKRALTFASSRETALVYVALEHLAESTDGDEHKAIHAILSSLATQLELPEPLPCLCEDCSPLGPEPKW
jgi:hypothetical protein